jgi:UTP--glucose-1-phosphate uridylyltransferase
VAVTTAVVPVAGLATRLRPLSRGVPKALLPVAGRPVIQHIVDELAACGIERVVLVTGRGRAGFAAHFAEAEGPEIVCVEQPRPLGLGDAILRAAPELDGPFAIALGDALLGHGAPVRVLERLAAAVRQGASVAIAVEEVAPADTLRYGIVAPASEGEGESRAAPGEGESHAAPEDEPFPIAGVVEKPAPEAAPSRLAIAGRYAATPALLEALRDTPLGSDGEVGLSDALSALEGVVAVRLAPGEERLDVGTVPGYCAAFVEHALSDAVLGPALRARAATLLDGPR